MTSSTIFHGGLCERERVHIAGATVDMHLRVTDEQLAAHLNEASDAAEAVKEILREGLVACHARTETAATLGLSELRRDISGGLDGLSAAAATASEDLRRVVAVEAEALRAEAARLVSGIRMATTDAQQAMKKAVQEAVTDPTLAANVEALLSGDSSPFHGLEERLEELSKAHRTVLGSAVQELSRASQTLAAQYGRREGEERTTKVGEPFEIVIEDLLARAAAATGDVVVDVRHTDGRNGSRKGDYLVEVNDNDQVIARVAVEVKNISRGASQHSAIQLIRDTLAARDAHAALYVVGSPEVMPAGLRGQSLGLIGSSAVAVAVDPADNDAVQLLASAYQAARVIGSAAAARRRDNADRLDTAALDRRVEAVRQRIDELGNIERDLRAAAKVVSSHASSVKTLQSRLQTEIDGISRLVPDKGDESSEAV